MFIVLEGIDGCGKSTIRKDLYSNLGPDQTFTHGKHAWFDISASRHIVNSRMNRFTGSTAQLVTSYLNDKIALVNSLTNPSSKINKYVIADRYVLSDFVYLSVLYDIDSDYLHEIYLRSKLAKADVTFMFDLNVETAVQRLSKRNKELAPYGWPSKMDYWETSDYLSILRERYISTINKIGHKYSHEIIWVNADDTMSNVSSAVRLKILGAST